MAHGWNLHNHLTIKKSFQIMDQGVKGFGIRGLNLNMVWGLRFGVFDAWFGVWDFGFGIGIEVWGLGLRGVGFGM